MEYSGQLWGDKVHGIIKDNTDAERVCLTTGAE